MIKLIKLVATVLVLLATFIAVEVAVTVIRPHRCEEAEWYESSRLELEADRATLYAFMEINR